jgi:hypothetical protein
MTALWRERSRLARRTAIGLAVLGVLTVGGVCGVVWRASSIVNRLLRDWAVGAIAQQSGGVYRLDPGRVRLNWLFRRVAVDSIHLTTNRGINAHRPQPLAALRVALYNCTISGVHLTTLARGAGLIARSFGCQAGSVAVELPRRGRDSTAAEPSPAPPASRGGERRSFLVLKQGLHLPPYAPRVRITRIAFPDLAFAFRVPRARGRETRLELERLQWRMADLVIDPGDTTAAARPLFSRTIELVANNFMAHPDSAAAVRVGLLRASLTDSTLETRGVSFAPTVSDAEFARSRRYRRDLIKITVGRTLAQGLDFGAFAAGQGAGARRLEVDSFRMDITNDKRRPENPSHQPHRAPQRWIADLDETLSLDSVVVQDGEVVYREQSAGRAQPGVMTFARIQAIAAHVRHVVGRRTSGDAMTLTATGHLQNVGRLDVQFDVPLDAPQFDMTFRGTLGAMPATALNPFVQEVFPLRIAKGHVAGITFSAAVANGVARGTTTPRYNDLSVSVTRRGSEGILGGGGILGDAARGIASFVGNWMKVRANNPDDPAKTPRTGRIRHVFAPTEALPAFLWASVRDGLLQVVSK